MPSKPKHPLPDIDKNIGNTLAKLRKVRGLTQIELAEKAGISQQQLSHYENGNIHITAEMVIRLAEILGITADELLNLQSNSTNSTLSLRFTRRIRELENLQENKKKAILQVLDDLIRANS
ncbi:MAG: helix-turn-helix transcriptional regulator [Bacteroidales bacterium]|nr:helix-turn-helix transcriptional regulator [Bacteroidales bacterium]